MSIRERGRRSAAVVALAGLLLAAGCLGFDPAGATDAVDLNEAESATFGAEVVSEAPDDATVVQADDERLENASELRSLAERAVESEDGYASETIHGEQLKAVEAALDEIPFSSDAGAYYLRYDGKIVRVSRL